MTDVRYWEGGNLHLSRLEGELLVNYTLFYGVELQKCAMF